MKINPQDPCPCGKDKKYQLCCQPYHLNTGSAKNIECLMRSRYSAFVLHQFQYLLDTHHPAFLNGLNINMLAQGAKETQWLGLEVEDVKQQEQSGTVTFKAWYLNAGDIDAIYECSTFINTNDKWYYSEGTQMQVTMPKRNDKCICHSGKKFKACCLKKIT